MSLVEVIPDIAERVARGLTDPSLRVLLAFDGDGTAFKQDRNRQCWEINPAIDIIDNLTKIARKGHYLLLTSARHCGEIAASPFKDIPGIDFQGNDGTVTIFKGQRFESVPLPNWSRIHAVMESEFGGNPEIRNIPMEHFYGCQMWDSHPRYQSAGDLLSSLLPRVDHSWGRTFRATAVPEGHCVMPEETPGKRKGYFAYVNLLPREIGLHIACGNGENDKDMLTAVGNKENGIAFWVGTRETKPTGTNVFAIPNEDALSAILGDLGVLLPDLSK
ncbi:MULTISPECIES: hypothetical protein [Rhizobium/Agrobacterium group]|uniref:Riorf11 protein n=5 Tax=Rhizobium/Agrobacterium group TaxID=227290 RepID=Q9F5H6_RHIRH|nr:MULTISPECIES: hypothetical protein [Rhizobium/Agrobacterium group]ABS11819.1 hypothetical protein [Rhizobium rhizogenes]AQS65391.1 hypothetical protein B0909_23660 [Rhizobium rhizogenes]ASK42894.1 hypothetical protein [Rhizobium rhizogenes]MCZ7445551.1 hypothetical protein [Rhizobium rhizogenes]MCZ7472503.1 hypothetical protein [Rhizobium rhizogenes]